MSKLVGKYVYHINDWLGSGTFATVYKGHDPKTNTTVAIKEVNLKRLERFSNGDKILKNLLSEIETMKTLRHKNIVQLHDVIMIEHAILLVLDYCNSGDLYSYLRKQPNVCLNEAQVHNIAVQIASGMGHMHYYQIVHRDLKPQNILLTTNESGDLVIKIADFGFAKVMTSQLAETMCGSPLYMAPEILYHNRYSDVADLWSYGIIIYELLVGYVPFYAKNILELTEFHRIHNRLGLPSNIFVSHDCRQLIASLLVTDPLERIHWNQFLNHPWIRREQITTQIEIPEIPNVIGSAPMRATFSRPPIPLKRIPLSGSQTNVFQSFIVINRESQLQLVNDLLHLEIITDHQLKDKLAYWVLIMTNLLQLGDTRSLRDARLFYQQCVNVINLVEKALIVYLREKKQKDINELAEITLFTDLFDNSETILLIIQINNLREESEKKLEKSMVTTYKLGGNQSAGTPSGSTVNSLGSTGGTGVDPPGSTGGTGSKPGGSTACSAVKPIDRYIYDMARSLRQQGDIETQVEDFDGAKTHYRQSILLLESLVFFSTDDVKRELMELITYLKKRI